MEIYICRISILLFYSIFLFTMQVFIEAILLYYLRPIFNGYNMANQRQCGRASQGRKDGPIRLQRALGTALGPRYGRGWSDQIPKVRG